MRHIEAGMGRVPGGAARRARGRLHGAVDQPVAGGGVHPAAVHGRAGGPAVPRVRDHAVGRGADLAGDLADHHADDVRAAAAPRAQARRPAGRPSWPARWRARFDRVLRVTSIRLDWALASKGLVMLILLAVVGLNVYLFAKVPKGFFPQQDNGQLNGGLRADQSISSEALQEQAARGGRHHPQGPGGRHRGGLHGRQPRGRRLHVRQPQAGGRTPGEQPGRDRAPAPAARKSPACACSSARCRTCAWAGARATRPTSTRSRATTSPTCACGSASWPRLKQETALTDVDSDQSDNGVETYVTVDRETASRMGITSSTSTTRSTTPSASAQVATIYDELNQYA
jgi:multidrug efflux pump